MIMHILFLLVSALISSPISAKIRITFFFRRDGNQILSTRRLFWGSLSPFLFFPVVPSLPLRWTTVPPRRVSTMSWPPCRRSHRLWPLVVRTTSLPSWWRGEWSWKTPMAISRPRSTAVSPSTSRPASPMSLHWSCGSCCASRSRRRSWVCRSSS